MSVHYSSPTRPWLRLYHAQRIDYHTGVLKEDSAAAKSSTTSVHDSLQLRVLDTDWCARDELQPAEFSCHWHLLDLDKIVVMRALVYNCCYESCALHWHDYLNFASHASPK